MLLAVLCCAEQKFEKFQVVMKKKHEHIIYSIIWCIPSKIYIPTHTNPMMALPMQILILSLVDLHDLSLTLLPKSPTVFL